MVSANEAEIACALWRASLARPKPPPAGDDLVDATMNSPRGASSNLDMLGEHGLALKKANAARARRAAADKNASSEPKRCHCVKSQCLKLYCECFARGAFCDGCNCADCRNIEANLEHIEKKRSDVRLRDPDAFNDSIKAGAHRKGCNCKKSQCLKMYCECYKNNVACADNCKCNDCRNTVDGLSGGAKSTHANDDKMSLLSLATAVVPLPSVCDGTLSLPDANGGLQHDSGSSMLGQPMLPPPVAPALEQPAAALYTRAAAAAAATQEPRSAVKAERGSHSKTTTTASSANEDEDDAQHAAAAGVQTAMPATPSLVSLAHGRLDREARASGRGVPISSESGPAATRGRSRSIGGAPGATLVAWGIKRRRSGPGRSTLTATDSGGDSRPASCNVVEETSNGSTHARPALHTPGFSSPLTTGLHTHPPTPDLEHPASSRRHSQAGRCTSPSVPHARHEGEWDGAQPLRSARGERSGPGAEAERLPSSLQDRPPSGKRGDADGAVEGRPDVASARPQPQAQSDAGPRAEEDSRWDQDVSVGTPARPDGAPAAANAVDSGREGESRLVSGAAAGTSTPSRPKAMSELVKARREACGASPVAELVTTDAGRCLYPGGRTPDAGLLPAHMPRPGVKNPCLTEEDHRQAQAFFHDSPVPNGHHSLHQTLLLSPMTPMTPRNFSALNPPNLGLSPSPAMKLDMSSTLKGSNKRLAADSEINGSASKHCRWTDDSPSHVPLLTQLLTPKPDDWSTMMQELLVDYNRSPYTSMTPGHCGLDLGPLHGSPALPPDALLSPLALRDHHALRQPKSRRQLRWSANGQCLPPDAVAAPSSAAGTSLATDSKSMRLQALEYMSAATHDAFQ